MHLDLPINANSHVIVPVAPPCGSIVRVSYFAYYSNGHATYFGVAHGSGVTRVELERGESNWLEWLVFKWKLQQLT